MQPLIVQGDRTTHGGTVLKGSLLSNCDGKPIARVGDMVACPLCQGVFPISHGDQAITIDGAAVAYHGCKTACGAELISSQVLAFTEPLSGAAPGVMPINALARFGAIGAGMAATYEDEGLGSANDRFRGRFQLVSAEDGTPISGASVRVRSTTGQYFTGTTDAEGFTQWVVRDTAEMLAFDLTAPKA